MRYAERSDTMNWLKYMFSGRYVGSVKTPSDLPNPLLFLEGDTYFVENDDSGRGSLYKRVKNRWIRVSSEGGIKVLSVKLNGTDGTLVPMEINGNIVIIPDIPFEGFPNEVPDVGTLGYEYASNALVVYNTGTYRGNINIVVLDEPDFVRLEGELTKYVFSENYGIGLYNLNNPKTFACSLYDNEQAILTDRDLLNGYGNFENDSNSDGLADNWTKDDNSTASLVTGIFSDHAQKLYYDNSGGADTVTIHLESINFYQVSETNLLFLKAYLKKESENTESNNPIIEIQWYDESQEYLSSSTIEPTTSSDWISCYDKLTTPANASYFKLKVYLDIQAGNIGSFAVDNLVSYNLTNLGELDATRQAKYSVTNWEELDKDTLAYELFAKAQLYGTTIVNLLGKYGNFETDSDEDGLADGWAKFAGSTNFSLSNNEQSWTGNGTENYGGI